MTILFLSVGSSADPIINAIRSSDALERVLFVVSGAEGKQPGSVKEIPEILKKSGFPEARAEKLVIPADDPAEIFRRLRERVQALRKEYPHARLVFDYTGGTKSMSAALFACALTLPEARLQLMAGLRENLEKVTPGTERPTPVPIDWLLAERAENRLRAAWRAHAYAECAREAGDVLKTLAQGGKPYDEAGTEIEQRLALWAKAAEAFDAWDRFEHGKAHETLRKLGHPAVTTHAALAGRLAEEEGLRIRDLWNNALRCEQRGRYDDAVARSYRLIEWTAQWHLRRRYAIDTGKMDWDNRFLTDEVIKQAGLEEQKAKKKKTLSGLVQTLKLAAALDEEGVFARFLAAEANDGGKKRKTNEKRLLDMLDHRNHSILAHGTKPISHEKWEEFRSYLETWIAQVLDPLLREAGLDPESVLEFPLEPPE